MQMTTKDDLANEWAELAQFAKSALIESAATDLVNIGRLLFKDGEPQRPRAATPVPVL